MCDDIGGSEGCACGSMGLGYLQKRNYAQVPHGAAPGAVRTSIDTCSSAMFGVDVARRKVSFATTAHLPSGQPVAQHSSERIRAFTLGAMRYLPAAGVGWLKRGM